MKAIGAVAITACLAWSAHSAQAQYGGYYGRGRLAWQTPTPALPPAAPGQQGFGPSPAAPYAPPGSQPPEAAPLAPAYPLPSPSPAGNNSWVQAPAGPAWSEPAAQPLAPMPDYGMGGYEEPYASDGFDGCAACATGCGYNWFVSLSGLYMSRDNPNGVTLTVPTGSNTGALLTTRDADFDWRGGFEVRFGRMVGLHRAVEATYWYLDPFDRTASVRHLENTLSTPLDFGTITAGRTNVNLLFDNAREHRISRRNEYHNVEVNLLHQPFIADVMSRYGLTWLTGFRFLRFDEGLLFGSAAAGTEFGQNGGATSAFYDVDVTNDLIGFQVGARGQYYVFDGLRLYALPKVGIYGNHIGQQSQVYRADGNVGLDVRSTKDDVSMLGQLDLGASWQITGRFSIFAAYRAVAAAGVALSDNQMPHFVDDGEEIRDIDSNGSLILDGGVFGVQWLF